jgi:hypothetical protein
MNTGWSSDFSYRYYETLLQAIKAHFHLRLFSDVPQFPTGHQEQPIILLRHDVDLDLDIALTMAEIESDLGISSCYMVMTNCPFYTLEAKSSRSILLRLEQLGHEIALHFDSTNYNYRRGDVDLNSPSVIAELTNSVKRLEDVISRNVYSISFHRPLRHFLGGPLFICGKVNAYSAELMTWYLSDSKGTWRQGEPLQMLKNPQKPLLQLLVHPIWWGVKHMKASDRLQSFFERRTQDVSEERRKTFSNALSQHLGVVRSGDTGQV